MGKNRYDLAAGIQYSAVNESTPTVILKGEADIADRAAAIAARFGIPIVEDAGLAEAMQSLPLDSEIPEELFRAVAVVLNRIERGLEGPPKRRRSLPQNGR